jgi:hypothetical protein
LCNVICAAKQQEVTKMNRINLFRNAVRSNRVTLDSVTWGKSNFDKTGSTLVFAGLLIVCSIAVGCSSDKPKAVSSNQQPAVSQQMPPAMATPMSTAVTPAVPAAAKPVHKKIVRKVAPTVTYDDHTSGISFQYPRKYSLKTGEAADKLVSADPVPMDFVAAGGVAVAAVAVPESAYPKSDLGAAFFNVSVNKTLTAEQCGEFSEAKLAPTSDAGTPAVTQPKKLMIGDMELMSSESLVSQGAREEAAKYYHVFENGACYEFALKVATGGIDNQGGTTHVDREEVFKKLEKILATVKIKAPEEVTASGTAATQGVGVVTPAQ